MIVSFCNAQDSTDTLKYYIETNNGNIFIGKIIEKDSASFLFLSDNYGKMRIKNADINKKYCINKLKICDQKIWFDNPQSTRYFFSPNANGLKAGEGYYQNAWIMLNSFAVGVTDYFSIGGGIIPLFLFDGSPTPFLITPKFSIPVIKEKISLGAGALIGTVIGVEESGFGILYGMSTFGSRDKNLSIGIGYGYVSGELVDVPLINVNAMVRTGARGYFITENYFVRTGGETSVVLSLGGRQIINKAGLDYGLVIPFFSDLEEFIAIPWLGITIPLNKKSNK